MQVSPSQSCQGGFQLVDALVEEQGEGHPADGAQPVEVHHARRRRPEDLSGQEVPQREDARVPPVVLDGRRDPPLPFGGFDDGPPALATHHERLLAEDVKPPFEACEEVFLVKHVGRDDNGGVRRGGGDRLIEPAETLLGGDAQDLRGPSQALRIGVHHPGELDEGAGLHVADPAPSPASEAEANETKAHERVSEGRAPQPHPAASG